MLAVIGSRKDRRDLPVTEQYVRQLRKDSRPKRLKGDGRPRRFERVD